ncbi:MAG: EAL domain-containing protein [Betaproteobacteria bacterium]
MVGSVSPWHSLKTRITLAALAIFLLGIWSLAFYVSQMLRQDMERLLGEQQFSTASLVASQINRELEGRIEVLKEVARLSPEAMRKGPVALQVFLEQRRELFPEFNGGVFVTGLNGVAIASTPPRKDRIGINYSDRDYLAAVLKDGKVAISQPIMGRVSLTPVIVVAVPIHGAQGQMIGVLSGVVNLAHKNFLDEVTENQYGKTGGVLLVVPQIRLVATATDKRRVMEVLPAPGQIPLIDRFISGYEGSGVTVSPQGIEVLASARGIPVTGWYVTITMPTAEAFAPIRDMQKRMLVAAIVLTLLAGLLIWWMLKYQLYPLLSTANILAKMSDASQTARPLPVVRDDEIGQVIAGFNDLLETLRQREAFLRQVMDTSSVAIFLVDQQGRITQANQRMAEMFALSLDVLVGIEYVELIHPSERETGRQRMLQLLSSEVQSVDLDRLYWRADLTEFWGHLTGRKLLDADGVKLGLVGVIADISVRKEAEKKLQLAASVFTHAREGITITAADGTIVDVNDSFTRITGYSREEAIGSNPRVLKSEHHPPEFYAAMWRDLLEKGNWTGEIWNRRKSGEVYPEMLTISAVADEHGVAQHYVALFTDISPMKAHEKQLEHMAHYDVLTGLPNRVLLADRMRQAMVQAQRRGKSMAVAYLDLDGFKEVNDTYGHKTGDHLLIALSSAMKQTLRESDTFARLGGDEFVAVLSDVEDISTCVPMLSRLLEAAAQKVSVDGQALQVSASLGVTLYPQAEETDADQLLRQADQAMYQAKLSGRNRCHIFDAAQDRNARGRNENLEAIRSALAAREFVLYYQPKVNMRTGQIIGAEALIRWQHPERGLLSPALFLPDVENHPLDVKIGDWVIETALTQMELWRVEGLDIPISVNVSANQLQQRDFVLGLSQLLDAHPAIRPGDLELEVLETNALDDLARVSKIIDVCKQIGVRFSLDDFGTGYSSLTYLKSLAVNQLKIDQSFVRDMLNDSDDLTILEGVISLAAAFRREVIAEGVETIEHGTLLLQLGCERGQGYGIARPMPAADFPAWAKRWTTDPAWKDRLPVARTELPVLFARTDHRAWLSVLDAHLKTGGGKPPAMDLHKCRFGQWLDHDARDSMGTYQTVDKLHQQVHALALDLCAWHERGRSSEVEGRLPELHALSDALLEELGKALP